MKQGQPVRGCAPGLSACSLLVETGFQRIGLARPLAFYADPAMDVALIFKVETGRT
jgi:hypothetical protein